MVNVQFLQHTPSSAARPAEWHAILSHTHTYSGRSDHGGTIKPPTSYQCLAAWAGGLGIAALGMGSPYTPATAQAYDRFDGGERQQYYRTDFDRTAVRGDDEISAMLAQINEFSRGQTLFFLDNETPKGRYGHLWWVNYHLDMPAWHDYDQDFDRWMVEESSGDADEPMPYLRRPYSEIVASQRAHGALANWAHPTSWWPGSRGQFITNIASEMPAHLIADGFLDGLVVMGYHGFRPEYQDLWFSMLDRGYRVPGVAEMDASLSDTGLWEKKSSYLTLVHADRKPQTAADVAAAWRSGNLIAASGAWVSIEVNGVPMGAVAVTSDADLHQVTLNYGGDSTRYDVELIGRGGQVLWAASDVRAGTTHLTLPGLSERGYLLARVFALKADGTRDSEQCAVGNPVYLHPCGQEFEKPAITQLDLEFLPSSRWRGETVRFETAGGELLGQAKISEAKIQEALPAGGRITLSNDSGARETYYLINANHRLNDVQRYLYRGRFLRDCPSLRPGEVPPALWRFEEYQRAMESCSLIF